MRVVGFWEVRWERGRLQSSVQEVSRGYDCSSIYYWHLRIFGILNFCFTIYCGAAGVYFFLVTVYWIGEKLWGK
jgi:hypothetical protein